MPLDTREIDKVICKSSRYAGDESQWLKFETDGSWQHDVIADQLDALGKALTDGFPTAEEAATAIAETFFPRHDDTPLKEKG